MSSTICYWYGVSCSVDFCLLGELNKFLNEFVVDSLVDKDSAGGETYLSLVGKRRLDHDWQTFV